MAGTNVGNIYVGLNLDDKDFIKGLKDAQESMKDTGSRIGNSMKSAERGSKILLGSLVAVGAAATAAFGAFVIKGGIDRALNIEDAQAKLRGLGHDMKSIESIMVSALASVKGTAFGLDAAATAAASAVAAGVKPGKDLTKYLTTVGDAATIAGVSFNEMSSIFGKVQTQQRAYTMEINQLADRGIPIYQWLQKELGVSQEALRDMVKDGEIDSETYFKVIQKNIGGAALESGRTTRGAWANMKAAMARVGAAITKDIIPRVRESFLSITEWFDKNSDRIVAAFGRIVEAFQGEGFKNALNWVKNNMPVVAGAIMMALVPALWALAGSIWAVVGPLLPFIALGALLGFLVQKLVNHFGGWNIAIARAKDVLTKLWAFIGPVLMPMLEYLWATLKNIWEQTKLFWQENKHWLIPTLKILAALVGGALMFALVTFMGLLVGIAKLVQVVIRVVRWLITTFKSFVAFTQYGASLIIRGFIAIGQWMHNLWAKIVYYVDKIKNKFSEIKQSIKDAFSAGNIGGAFKGFLGKLGVPGFARGVTNFGGGLAVVGEQGPELVNLPRGSDVIPNDKIGVGGSTVNVNVNMEGIIASSRSEFRELGKQFIEAVNEELRAKGVAEL